MIHRYVLEEKAMARHQKLINTLNYQNHKNSTELLKGLEKNSTTFTAEYIEYKLQKQLLERYRGKNIL